MFNTVIITDETYILEGYEQLLAKAPEVTNRLVNEAVNANRDRLLANLRQEPGPVVYSRDGKLAWKSDRQRRAFFASNGFGRGIPYQRKTAPNRLVDQWRLIVVYDPGQITSIGLINPSPIERYVTGKDQQPFHAITGWYRTQSLIDQTAAELTSDIETALIRSFYAVEDL